MDANHWIMLANLVALLLSVVVNVWMFLSMRTDSRWTAFHTRVNTVETRLSVVETQMRTVPDQDDLLKIHEKLGHIDRLVAGQVERSNSVITSVARIESYLLGSAKR